MATRPTIAAACVLAAAAAAMPGPSSAQGRGDLTITIGPKGIELGVRDKDRRGGDYRRRCLERHEFDRVLAYQGWQDLHDRNYRGDTVTLKARQWGGLYRLDVDECSGQLLEARRLDFDRGYWQKGRGRR